MAGKGTAEARVRKELDSILRAVFENGRKSEMTIKRSTLIEGILIICMVAVLGLVTAIREPVVEKNQVKTIEEPKVETANIYILKNIYYTGTYVVGTWTDEFGNEQQVKAKMPSAGSGSIYNGGNVALQTYETLTNGTLENCFYWQEE